MREIEGRMAVNSPVRESGMTEQEAIEEIKRWTSILMSAGSKCVSETAEAQYMAIRALEEIYLYHKCKLSLVPSDVFEKICEENDAYKEIGTVEECRKAVEKQKSKICDISGDGYADGHMVYDMYECPNCGKVYEIDCEKYEYCPNCGQHMLLEWSDEDETD